MRFILFNLLLALVNLCFGLTFVRPPSIAYNSSQANWTLSFEVSESTDVEVTLVSLRDSLIVRHLAAGMLGANPPSPLIANTLSQTLVWDGKDDLGNVVAIAPESVSVRVRAGMAANLDQYVGGSPYAFAGMFGIAEGDSGMVYVAGGAEPWKAATIRAYDGAGNYIRTIFPFRGDFATAQVSGFGVNNWLNGSYSPKYFRGTSGGLACPTLTNTALNGGEAGSFSMLPINLPGEIAIGGGVNMYCFKFNSDGTVPNGSVQVSLITSPALPDHYGVKGPIYFNLSHNPGYIYLSGYLSSNIDAGCHFVSAKDNKTEFWGDGCVYKISLATGEATRFITLDSVLLSGQPRDDRLGGPSDFYAAIHSLKTDAAGNVLICDRSHQQIGVYDTTGVFLRAIKNVPYADQIYVDKTSGAVYVVCRSGWHYDRKNVIFKKFSGSDVDDSLVFSVPLWLNSGEGPINFFVQKGQDNKPLIWICHGDIGVRIYSDEGDTVNLVKDFYASRVNTLIFDRIALDRCTETVFINNGENDLFKVSDWADPALTRCSTSTGQPLYAGDACVSFDNQLYTRGGPPSGTTGAYNGPIQRWTLDDYPAPISFSGTGNNSMCPEVYSRMGYGYGDKGFAVSPLDKHVAVMQMHAFSSYWVDTIEADGTTDSITSPGEWLPRTKIKLTTGGLGGVKFDIKGNLYVGSTIMPADHRTPSGFETDECYTRGGGGSITRYAPGDTGTISQASATNSNYTYKANYGLMSGYGTCMCRTARFDVDAFGRLFIPSSVTQKVAIVDNNDNPILEFGRYGNWDEIGGGADVPLICPLAVAASDNYIYVNDLIGTRMARVRMTYALDNMPGLPIAGVAGRVRAFRESPLRLTAAPNPFNPAVSLTISGGLSHKPLLRIYDTSGKLVADLSANVRNGQAVWNAEGFASGVYMARAENENRVVFKKIIYSK